MQKEEGEAPRRRLERGPVDSCCYGQFVSYLSDAVSGTFVSARSSGRGRTTPVGSATAAALLFMC